MAIARKLRIKGNLPHKLWPYMVAHATRLLNRIPIQRKKWQTPFEMVHGRKPNLSQHRIIGSLAYVLIKNQRNRPSTAKLKEKAIKGWLVGLDATNIYKVWIPHLDRVVRSRDVRIDEKVKYNPDYDTTVPESGQTLTIIINEIDLDEEDMDPSPIIEDTTQLYTETLYRHLPTPQGSTQPTVVEDIQVQASDAQPPSPVSITRDRRVTDALALENLRTSTGRTVRLSKRGQDAIDALSPRQVNKRARRHAHALRLDRAKIGDQVAHAFAQARSIKTHRKDLSPPPETWYQLKRHPERKGLKQAADLEIQSLEEKGAFKLVDQPKDKQVLPLKWVFTYKFDQAGYLDKHKARICARGDLQHYTGEDIYAATGAYRSFRILMAIVCAYGLICHQIDFKLAFINADMDEEVYTTCPPGYGRPGKVWKLLKALYGLRKSPKLWYKELVSFLQGHGFQPCTEEPCIMINNETKLVLFLFVDDMLIMAPPNKDKEVQKFKQDVQNKYDIKDLGEASSFLNIRIRRDIGAKKLWICQDGYIDKICVKFGIDETKPMATPLPSSYHPLPNEGQATMQQIMEMQEKVGSILYPAVVTRPDISFAASQLGQFTLNPSHEHLRYANRILSYLQTTKVLCHRVLRSYAQKGPGWDR